MRILSPANPYRHYRCFNSMNYKHCRLEFPMVFVSRSSFEGKCLIHFFKTFLESKFIGIIVAAMPWFSLIFEKVLSLLFSANKETNIDEKSGSEQVSGSERPRNTFMIHKMISRKSSPKTYWTYRFAQIFMYCAALSSIFAAFSAYLSLCYSGNAHINKRFEISTNKHFYYIKSFIPNMLIYNGRY